MARGGGHRLKAASPAPPLRAQEREAWARQVALDEGLAERARMESDPHGSGPEDGPEGGAGEGAGGASCLGPGVGTLARVGGPGRRHPAGLHLSSTDADDDSDTSSGSIVLRRRERDGPPPDRRRFDPFDRRSDQDPPTYRAI